jgi:LemA protein
MDTAIYVLLAVAALGVVWAIITLNGFVRARNLVDESWSGVDVQLKRRHDLVPNLVETVKGYAAHESGVLEKVTEARAAAIAASEPEQQGKAEASLTSALGGIRAVAEQYPQLRASENFQRLQAELAEIEDQIQAARRIYNANVRDYNTRLQIFPNSLLSHGYQPRRFFEIEDVAERAVPAVAFG